MILVIFHRICRSLVKRSDMFNAKFGTVTTDKISKYGEQTPSLAMSFSSGAECAVPLAAPGIALHVPRLLLSHHHHRSPSPSRTNGQYLGLSPVSEGNIYSELSFELSRSLQQRKKRKKETMSWLVAGSPLSRPAEWPKSLDHEGKAVKTYTYNVIINQIKDYGWSDFLFTVKIWYVFRHFRIVC